MLASSQRTRMPASAAVVPAAPALRSLVMSLLIGADSLLVLARRWGGRSGFGTRASGRAAVMGNATRVLSPDAGEGFKLPRRRCQLKTPGPIRIESRSFRIPDTKDGIPSGSIRDGGGSGQWRQGRRG